jgi:hypothetical protein
MYIINIKGGNRMINDILIKNKLDILTEAASTEDFAVNSTQDDMNASDLEFALEDGVATLAYDLTYPVQSIPVIEQESAYDNGKIYVVEYDMLDKLMESYDVDEVEAMHMLCEANQIDYDDLYLAIESTEYFLEKMEEIGGSQLKGRKTRNLVKSISDLKDKGIKMTKKPSGKKKKKKGKRGIEITIKTEGKKKKKKNC